MLKVVCLCLLVLAVCGPVILAGKPHLPILLLIDCITKVFDFNCIARAHWGTILPTRSRSRVVQLALQATCLSCPSNTKAQREQRWKPALLWRCLSPWLRSFQGLEWWSSEFYYIDNQNMFYVIILSNRTQLHLSIIFNNSIFKTTFIPIILNRNKIFVLQILSAEDVVFLYWRNYSLVARARLARSDSTSSCQLISVPFDNNSCPSSSAIKGKLVTVGRKLVFDKNTKIQNNQLWY